ILTNKAMGMTVARDPSVGGNVGLSQVNNTVEMSRKEKRRVERGNETIGSSPLFQFLDAVRMMEERLNGGLQNINKNLETMNRRIDRLEDQQDEIADSMETQRTLIAHKAAEGTDTITEMLPSPPPGILSILNQEENSSFSFFLSICPEPRVRELDEEHDDFLSFAAALDREIFTASERSQPLSKRDKIREVERDVDSSNEKETEYVCIEDESTKRKGDEGVQRNAQEDEEKNQEKKRRRCTREGMKQRDESVRWMKWKKKE
uniref:Uncharacterized protein n=1 Tax=Pristionchus pacificus TaxID=54126 RepID=A0A8R1YFZ7_PRIPA